MSHLLPPFRQPTTAHGGTRRSTAVRISTLVVLFIAVTFYPPATCSAAEELYEQEAFYTLILTEKFDNQEFRIFPVDLPAAPQPSDELRIRFFEFPEKFYDISWSDIERIITFEQAVLSKANLLIAEKKFDTAYWYLEFLRREHPNLPGISKAISTLIYQDAADANRRGAYGEALSLLDEVRKLGAGGSALVTAADGVAKKMFRQYVADKNYPAARDMIAWAEDRFGRRSFETTLSAWEDELVSLAQQDMEAAESLLKTADFRGAYDHAQRARRTWPKLDGLSALTRDIAERYPVVTVGVTRPALDFDPRRSEDWAARRTGRLRYRTLVELSGYGPDGGEYYCPIGSLEVTPDSQEITIKLQTGQSGSMSQSFSGYELANLLLEMARPGGPNQVPLWSQLVSGINVEDVYSVRVKLSQPVLRPEALLQTPLGSLADDAPPGPTNPYVVVERRDAELRLMNNPDYAAQRPTQPVEIVERYYDDPAQLVDALLAEEIDVADRLFPGDVANLQNNDDIIVRPYAVPSIHFLVPNFKRPLMQRRAFRRALVYGISRGTILEQDLLGKSPGSGTQLISGPAPPGATSDDPLGYAYNRQIKPRAYEPTLAITLAQVAKAELAGIAEKMGEDPPPTDQPLVLLHSASAVPRIASAAISQYLSAIGIPCEAREMRLGQTTPQGDDWDLLYVDMVFTEPMFDIRRLLGARGLVGGGSSYLELALRRLSVSVNWEQSRETLQEIHRLAHEEVAVVPLWQIIEYFAFHPRVKNLPDHPLSLYQNVESWQIERGTP